MVYRPGWKILPTRIGYCSNTSGNRRFRCEDNNVTFTNLQPHYYRVRQVEPCRHLGWSGQAIILSIWALGAMPKQQQLQVMCGFTKICLMHRRPGKGTHQEMWNGFRKVPKMKNNILFFLKIGKEWGILCHSAVWLTTWETPSFVHQKYLSQKDVFLESTHSRHNFAQITNFYTFFFLINSWPTRYL